MVAAVITQTYAYDEDIPTNTVLTGGRRIKVLNLEGVKATQADWFLLTSYLSATEVAQVIGIDIVEVASDNTHALGTYTYDSDDAKLVLASAKVGTAYARVRYYEV